jgi:hypothetical protein
LSHSEGGKLMLPRTGESGPGCGQITRGISGLPGQLERELPDVITGAIPDDRCDQRPRPLTGPERELSQHGAQVIKMACVIAPGASAPGA